MADFFAKGKNPINGYGGVDEGVIYSTEEHIIGKWIDGSTLYEKTVNCGALPNTTMKTVLHGISNLDHFVSISGIAYDSTVAIPLPRAYSDSNPIYSIDVYANKTEIRINIASNQSSITSSYITLRYTKTS